MHKLQKACKDLYVIMYPCKSLRKEYLLFLKLIFVNLTKVKQFNCSENKKL